MTNFEAMALRIMGQQISTAAALTIYRRMSDVAGGSVSSEGLLALSEDRLCFCGLSRAKASFLHDPARRQAEGTIGLEDMAGIDDSATLAALTAARGVGPWSAQMFHAHRLKRTDLLPASDIGIRRAVQRAGQLDHLVSRLAEGVGSASYRLGQGDLGQTVLAGPAVRSFPAPH